MFDYLSGKIATTELGVIVLDITGVGFRLLVPVPLSQQYREGEPAKLFTSVSLRNEEVKLYGFATIEERKMFEKLQTVSGIGPATALNILSASPVAAIYEAIVHEDLTLFRKVKGVGPKTAQRILLEFKGKVSSDDLRTAAPSPRVSGQQDAIAALVALGYPEEAAWEAVKRALKTLPSNPAVENLIREALSIVQGKQ